MTENSMTRKKGPLVWLDMDQKSSTTHTTRAFTLPINS
jgi:hypothetical protein